MSYYNFWGVVKYKHFYPGHPLYGFSLFKRGFGGDTFSYVHAKDYPLSIKYWFSWFIETVRRKKRGL